MKALQPSLETTGSTRPGPCELPSDPLTLENSEQPRTLPSPMSLDASIDIILGPAQVMQRVSKRPVEV